MSLYAPVIVLVCICFVASFMLAGVYGLTKPVIDELTERTNNEARMAVLPAADGFDEITGVELPKGVRMPSLQRTAPEWYAAQASTDSAELSS